ncbi:reverse transcriptase family protein [Rhizophagus irregularis DAOM 181602=DAOM 197198]|nr:reverse transcriptase family protein [Rhizophagus irregularis DAOM 181602=DAOM 197198]
MVLSVWIIFDHHILITVFDFSTCLAILAKSHLKQKKEGRVVFTYNFTTDAHWTAFSSDVSSCLQLDFNISGPYTDFDFSKLFLDKLWHTLKCVILGAAIKHLPKKNVSNTYRHSYPSDLTKLIAINKFLDKLLHLQDLTNLLPDYVIPNYTTIPLSTFKSFLRSQKSLVSAFLSIRFAQHASDSIEYYTALHDDYFSSFLCTFIDSALSVEKRSIVLDQVLVEIPWQKTYTPLSDVSASLYDPVLSPISLQEWSQVISSMPNNKASNPSKISYEMLKHLSGDALEFFLLLANSCLSRGDIPADWHEAVVYPISKPHDFDAQLKNAHSITLLETVRKCVVKVVTNRLSYLLTDNKILQRRNFAGLPVSHLTFMDDSTLVASSKSGIEDRLSITAEFYTLNNVHANSAKYVLLFSSDPSSVIFFGLSPPPLINNNTLTLTSLALTTSFRFLGVWFSLSASSQFVLKQARSMVKDMAALLTLKKLLAQHVAYLYNAVLLSRLEFRLQTSLFFDSIVQSIIFPMFSIIKRKAGLASTTPLALLYLKIPFSIQHAFCQFMGAESCPTTIDLTPCATFFACGKFLLPWPDLRYLGIVGKKGRIPAWFTFFLIIFYLLLILFFSTSFIINSFYTVASPLLLDNTVPDGQYHPLWTLSYDRITQTLLVGCICITYSKKDLAIMSYWLPSAGPESTSFHPCSDVSDDIIPSTFPCSACNLYTDGFFLASTSGNSPSMSFAWLVLDNDNLILESSSDVIPLTYPSALRSETFALLSVLKALAPYSSATVNTDCASPISLWSQFVDKPFLPKLLRQPNHLLWLSIRHHIHNKHLSITPQKVPAHADDISLSRFSHLAPVEYFDWKVLLDMLPTLTALQKRKPSLYPPDWLCPLCHFASEDMNHLWICPYIIPDASPKSIYHKLILSFHDACVTSFSELASFSDTFLLEFFTLDCWNFTTSSPSYLWLTRGLYPVDLVQHLSILEYLDALQCILSSMAEFAKSRFCR